MAHPFRHAILPALFVLVASVLLPACDGGDSSTTPAPAPSPAPAPPPPPPPPPEPAQIAGDWILVFESGRIPTVDPSGEDDCFVTQWWTDARGQQPVEEPDRILRVEQSGEEVTGHAWAHPGEVTADSPWPPDLDTTQPGWRFAGTVNENVVSLVATDRWRGESWGPYPYGAGEFPVGTFFRTNARSIWTRC